MSDLGFRVATDFGLLGIAEFEGQFESPRPCHVPLPGLSVFLIPHPKTQNRKP